MKTLEEPNTRPAPASVPSKGDPSAARRNQPQAPPDDRAPDSPPAARKPPRRLRLAAGVALAAALLLGIWHWRHASGPPDGIILVSGRIEGDDSAIAAKTGGRLREILFREGDRVEAGQTIARLDDDQVRARENQAAARLASSKGRVAVLEEQRKQSVLAVEQAQLDAQGRVTQAEAQVAAAEAQLAQGEAQLLLSRFDAERYGRLVKQGVESERMGQQVRSAVGAQEAVVNAARRQLDASRGALTAARANLTQPEVRRAQVAAVDMQLLQTQDDVRAAEAQWEEARADRADLEIKAPFSGTVSVRTAEPGEVLTAGTPVVTMVDLNAVYLRGFIPEGEIGRVRLGQPSRVYLDSDPKHRAPLDAVVQRVDPEASFTPENTYFRNERVKQVVGVKLLLRRPGGYAKPGMPADGEVLVDQSGRWPK